MDQESRTDEGLVRAIGVRTLAANGINLTVGSGIFVLPAAAAAALGPSAIFAYLVCAGAMLLVLLCFAEAGSRVARSGGAYAYVETAFGPFAGYLITTLLWFGYGVLSDAAIATALSGTLAAAFPVLASPAPRGLLLAAVLGGLAAINIAGVRHGARLAVAITLAKLAPLLILLVFGLAAVRRSNLAGTGLPSLQVLGDVSLLLFFAFAGAESALTPSGEIRDPTRTVPRGILASVVGVIALYAGIHLVAQGVLGEALAGARDAPLAAVAESVLGAPGRLLLLAGAALAMLGTLGGDMLATPRALFASARDGARPAILGAVHPRFRTPYVAIAAYAGITWVFAVTGAFRQLAIVSSAALLVIYLASCLACLELRRRDVRAAARVFRLPGGPLVPLLACVVVVWLLSHTPRRELLGLGALLVAAAAAYRWRRPAALPGR